MTSDKTPKTGLDRRTHLVSDAIGRAGMALGVGEVLAQAVTDAPEVAAEPPLPPKSAALAVGAVGKVSDAILRISREVWENAELSRMEEQSDAIHLRELESEGFIVTSRNTAGYPTAFITEWSQGNGGQVIAYLPEYDALPGLMSIGDKASLAMARSLAGAGYDLMTQPDLLAKAKADFETRRGDTKYASALAPDKKPEILPAYMHKAVGDDTLTPGTQTGS